jgi:DNA-binding XRE family transcriptional regulator
VKWVATVALSAAALAPCQAAEETYGETLARICPAHGSGITGFSVDRRNTHLRGARQVSPNNERQAVSKEHPAFKKRLGVVVKATRERLKEKAKERAADFTQEAIAHEADLSLRHYQALEGGRGNPRITALLDVARALDTTASKILAKTETEK